MQISKVYHRTCVVVFISLTVMLTSAYAGPASKYHVIKFNGTVLAINNNNVLVGQYESSDQVLHGFIKTPDGTVTTLDAPNSVSTAASGINTAGTVVGYYQDSAFTFHGFIYQNGTLSDFGPPGSHTSAAYAINDAGQIVGTSDGNAYLFDGTNYQTLSPPGSHGSGAHGINNSGMVTVEWSDGKHDHSSLYDGMNYTLIDVPGAAATYANSIDSAGDVVFEYRGFNTREHGALLTGGKYYRVEPPSECHDSSANGINDQRTIVGFCFHNGTRYAFWVTY